MHKKILEEMKKRASKEDLYSLIDVVDMSLDTMKEEKPELYEHIETILYESLYGKVISEEMAKEWVHSMLPYGQHWSISEAYSLAKQYDTSIKEIEAYVIMNMIYNDYHDILKDEDTSIYAKLTKGWLEDEDAKEDKLYCYYKNIVEK